jgi:hypothetical protein
MSLPIELGHEHSMTYATRYGHESEHVGVIVSHPLRPDDDVCAWLGHCHGWVEFDIPVNAADTGAKWTVESADPLTLSPSLLCHCGDHGFIRDGRWVPA